MLNPARDMSNFKEVVELRRKQFFQALSAETIVEIKAL
ncbi:Endoribonuclease L-PSP (fragment) [Mesorhizobium prunaredense]|uniref:Endoribonuclease L-PSP n=1 Tax=Mesorhizobium prunaredense TaxID=1631249 RepID=A0A1R3VE24_9HYPH